MAAKTGKCLLKKWEKKILKKACKSWRDKLIQECEKGFLSKEMALHANECPACTAAVKEWAKKLNLKLRPQWNRLKRTLKDLETIWNDGGQIERNC